MLNFNTQYRSSIYVDKNSLSVEEKNGHIKSPLLKSNQIIESSTEEKSLKGKKVKLLVRIFQPFFPNSISEDYESNDTQSVSKREQKITLKERLLTILNPNTIENVEDLDEKTTFPIKKYPDPMELLLRPLTPNTPYLEERKYEFSPIVKENTMKETLLSIFYPNSISKTESEMHQVSPIKRNVGVMDHVSKIFFRNKKH